jgi:hypothetical protein
MTEYERKIEQLATEYRRDVLLLLCKKHQICFWSGMGDFYFCPMNDDRTRSGATWAVGDEVQAGIERKRYLIPVLEVLNQEIEHGQYFGYFVQDVRPEDLV